jgi:aminoglycoside 6-adenylyltransferase
VLTHHDPQEVIRRIILWAEGKDAVRTVLLTSSRARPDAPVDVFSDYDVVLVVTDIRPFAEDRSWLSDFGDVLVTYWDPIEPENGLERTSNVIHYADGLHIDFNIWPVALLRRIAQASTLTDKLDSGYMVLVDKDNLTADLRAPTYRAYIPTRPSAETYQTWIEEFFSDAPYVAKCLWRDELLPAKWCLDSTKHVYLGRMLEWRMECDHDWAVPTGHLSRGLKKLLPSDIWQEFERTYVGADLTQNWEALFQTMALFRRVATEVGEALGYAYPYDLDRRVTAHVQAMRSVPHEMSSGS